MGGKLKAKSEASVASKVSKVSKVSKYHEEVPAFLDQLEMKIVGLWMSEEDPPYHAIRVTFYDTVILSTVVKPLGLADRMVVPGRESMLGKGILNYDPSNYEKMCLFADAPLIVTIQRLRNFSYEFNNLILNTPVDDALASKPMTPTKEEKSGKGSAKEEKSGKGSAKDEKSGKGSAREEKSAKGSARGAISTYPQPPTVQRPMRGPDNLNDLSSCNIDILPLFLDQDSICVKKRLQPMRARPYLKRQSWENLPLLAMSVVAVRHEENARHHQILQNANWMKVTVVGAYNLPTSYNADCYYTAATKIPMANESETEMVMYAEGTTVPRKFNSTSFYPRWESLRLQGDHFVKGDDKLECDLTDIANPDNIDLEHYLRNIHQNSFNVIWGSFHRSLVLGNAEKKLWNHFRDWKWPLEVHYYGDAVGGLSFMGFMDLFQLLYPGVRRLVVAVPLHWFSMDLMFQQCGCRVLLMPNNDLFGAAAFDKPTQTKTMSNDDSTSTYTEEGAPYVRPTGADEAMAFALVEVQFEHAMVPESIPPHIRRSEMMQMLAAMEPGRGKRACRERGQLSSNWHSTVRVARNALRRVPHHGLMEICVFNRQLSDSRTRIELLTSFWTDAAVFVNNNFVVSEFLESKETYEEMLLMAHACLMKSARSVLVGKDEHRIDPTLRAARHARQLNDMQHAVELYLQVVVEWPFEWNYWRELSTCMRDIDRDWAAVCLNKSISLNIRHPITILAKACMVFEENVDAAEPFFTSLLNLHFLWPAAYIVSIAYCTKKEYFLLADMIKKCLAQLRAEGMTHEFDFPRSWGYELGDFWEPTVLLPGMSVYYDVVDFLLRIRALHMAEVCLSLALTEMGETAAYYHLVAVCCRLKGDIPDAICLIQKGIELYGKNAFAQCLLGESYHQMEDTEKAIDAFSKGKASTPYSVLLSLPMWEFKQQRLVIVDLLSRHPNAYAWMALANDWIIRMEMDKDGADEPSRSDAPSHLTCAVACAEQALKCDRRAGRAWALLAKYVTPQKRRTFCTNMAINCGYKWVEETDFRDSKIYLKESACHRLATNLRDCRCDMCKPLHF